MNLRNFVAREELIVIIYSKDAAKRLPILIQQPAVLYYVAATRSDQKNSRIVLNIQTQFEERGPRWSARHSSFNDS